MPKIVIFEGSMRECINYTRFVNRPYQKREEKGKNQQRKRNPNNIKDVQNAHKWKSNDMTTQDESSGSDDEMSITEHTTTNDSNKGSSTTSKERSDTINKTSIKQKNNEPSTEDLLKDNHAVKVSKIQLNEQQKARNFQK
ncbi:U3 small nucleolar RNA-associated protein 25 [Frankliniella fusca]|uniref:U3 small nucleolar RNA-associated protein 25 n=1 Tax=Frankliniella fusca TaxID=407009 RepID=A0AAE1HWX1_9NEOP|nr:U3 small nucleolar RNA-associated protein 25 [Frankliniella fusca]